MKSGQTTLAAGYRAVMGLPLHHLKIQPQGNCLALVHDHPLTKSWWLLLTPRPGRSFGFYFAAATNYHNAIEFQKDTGLVLLVGDEARGADLLARPLKARGLENEGPVDNKNALFMLHRLDAYEEMSLSRVKGLMTENPVLG